MLNSSKELEGLSELEVIDFERFEEVPGLSDMLVREITGSRLFREPEDLLELKVKGAAEMSGEKSVPRDMLEVEGVTDLRELREILELE